MAYIAFTDAAGAASVHNGKPAPADRFAGWTPLVIPRGDAAHRASDGLRTMLKLRTDVGASFEIRGIRSRLTDASDRAGAGKDLLAQANRLVAWLLEGGTCEVHCEDTTGAVYPFCSLWPGSTPELTMTDPELLEYTLVLQLLNLGGSQMICRYR